MIRNSLNHRMLEPAQFYTFDNGARTLYFRRWRSTDSVSGMFIHDYSAEKKEEQIITAAEAEFRRNENGVVLIMSEGSIETIPADGSSIRTAHFDEYALPVSMQGSGGLPQRNWRGAFELPFLEFFRERPSSGADPRQIPEWTSEAAKRCGIPLLALVHALLAIGLVLNVASARGGISAAVIATVLAIPASPCRDSRLRRNAGPSGSAFRLVRWPRDCRGICRRDHLDPAAKRQFSTGQGTIRAGGSLTRQQRSQTCGECWCCLRFAVHRLAIARDDVPGGTDALHLAVLDPDDPVANRLAAFRDRGRRQGSCRDSRNP